MYQEMLAAGLYDCTRIWRSKNAGGSWVRRRMCARRSDKRVRKRIQRKVRLTKNGLHNWGGSFFLYVKIFYIYNRKIIIKRSMNYD